MIFGYFLKNLHLFNSLLDNNLFSQSCHFDDMTKNRSIQRQQFSSTVSHNRGSSRSIVHECQLPKRLTYLVSLDKLIFALVVCFVTVVVSLWNYVEVVAGLALFDHHLVLFDIPDGHGLHNDVFIFMVQILEEQRIFHILLDQLLFSLRQTVSLSQLQLSTIIVLNERIISRTQTAKDCAFLFLHSWW